MIGASQDASDAAATLKPMNFRKSLRPVFKSCIPSSAKNSSTGIFPETPFD